MDEMMNNHGLYISVCLLYRWTSASSWISFVCFFIQADRKRIIPTIVTS